MAAQSKLEVIISARDDASAKLTQLQGKVESFGSTFRRLSIGAAIGGAALSGALTLAAWAAAEEETSIARLARAVDNASKAVPILSSRYAKLVEDGRATRKEMGELETVVHRNRIAVQKVAEAMVLGKATTNDYNTAVAKLSESEAELASRKEALSGITKRQLVIMAEHEAALKKVKPAYADVRDEIEKTIAALQRKTTFGDGPQREALAALVALTGDYDEAMKRLPIAMDLATASGMDLTTAARLLGRVSDENIGVLRRYGIEVSDTATATELLAAITQKFGGQAEDAAKTAAGQIKQLRNAFDDLAEDIGANLLPIMKELIQTVGPFLQDLNTWIKANPELTRGIVLIGTALAILLTIVGTLGILLPILTTGFAALGVVLALLFLNPIGLIILAVALLIAGLVLLALNWDKVTARWNEDMAKLGTAWVDFQDLMNRGVNFLIGIAEALANAFIGAANAIIRALNSIQIQIPDWVPGIGGRKWGINLPTIPEVRLARREVRTPTEAEAFGLGTTGQSMSPYNQIILQDMIDRAKQKQTMSKENPVTINFNAPVYGMDEFNRRVTQAVRDAALGGAFRGITIGGTA